MQYIFSFRDNDLEYLPLRLWIGIWTTIILIILVALDASALVCYITRFTEENFATLISLIFIYKSIEKVCIYTSLYFFKTNIKIPVKFYILINAYYYLENYKIRDG